MFTLSSLFNNPNLNQPLLIHSTNCKPLSQQALVVLKVYLPHSCLSYCPCSETSQLVAMRPSLSQQLWYASWGRTCSNFPEGSSRARFCCTSLALSKQPLLSFLGSETKLSRRRHSSLSRLDDNRRQRLSSGFVARSAATFGVGRNHTDAFATEQDRGREAVEECTPSSILKKVLHYWNLCTTLVGRSDRSSTVHSYISDTHSPELSSNISLETSRNPGTFRTLLDYSGQF